MRYKITEQFARGEEKIIAEFSDLNDTHLFITKKLAQIELEKQKIIIRLYDDSDLLRELNKEHISVAYAKYAEGNGDLNLIQFLFRVLIRTASASANKEIANFNNKNNANLFMVGKCESDDTLLDSDLLFLFKEQTLMDTLNRTIFVHRQEETTRFSGDEKGAKFHPTPMPRRPTPPGGPSDCWIEEEDQP